MPADRPIRLAIVGVGNCASALVQGIALDREGRGEGIGIAHPRIGGLRPGDIEVVAAWDVDERKVGRDVADAIFALPNCTAIFNADFGPTGIAVSMGAVLDGVAPHMLSHPAAAAFRLSSRPEATKAEILRILRSRDVEVMVNYLPVGSTRAAEFYATCALEAGVAFVNAMPVFIASDPAWAARFAEAGIPLVGDDIKAQIGATIVHRVLTDLFARRGVALDRTYQLNVGGNTDFLNMTDPARLAAKKISKTEAVQAVAGSRLAEGDIHVGPSDYVAWQKDNKVCFLRMEGRIFGGVPMNIELRLSVEDSPNSAGIAIDMIRCARLARDRRIGGTLDAASAWSCKHPPRQMTDDEARAALERFIEDVSAEAEVVP